MGARKQFWIFLIITFVLSYGFEFYVVARGGFQAQWENLLLMWIPGLVCLALSLAFRNQLKSLGLRPGNFGFWILAFGVPLVIAALSNLLCWHFGINQFVAYPKELLDRLGLSSVPALIILKYPKLFLFGNIAALGEELGWRGFMLPKMIEAKIKRPLLWSSLIWAAWHYPLILGGVYASSSSPFISLVLFTVMIICSGLFIGWLRMESGSVWIAMFYHACHNIFLQGAFAPFNKYGPLDPLLGNESGLIPCLIYILVLLVGLKYRENLLRLVKPAEIAA